MSSNHPRFGFVAINGTAAGVFEPLDTRTQVISIGRDEARDLPVDDPLVSRLHARLIWDGNQWNIEDCESSNGTKVNSQTVQRAILQPGDLVRIGDRLLVFLDRRANDRPGLTPTRLVEATSLFRVEADSRQSRLFEPAGSNSQPLLSSECLSAVLKFTIAVHSQSSLARAARLAAETIEHAVGASCVSIWFTGISGRLQRIAASGDTTNERLLASVCMERNEAIAYGSDWKIDGVESPYPVTAAPIPGRHNPRGAIECRRVTGSANFEQADIDFVLAIGHQLGMAAEVFEHRESLERENQNLRQRIGGPSRLVGDSKPMKSVNAQLRRVAPTSSTVLILGESGTGKELVAQSIHDLGSQSAGPFVAVNCASFNESLLESELFGHESGAFTGADQRRIGQFERAHRGTIFLDEVGEMSLACQAKLLRVLEGHPFERLGGTKPIQVEIRVLAATHRDLRSMVDSARFREDLYFRLKVIELTLPPLRERGEDILTLAARFLEEFRAKLGRGPKRLSRVASTAMMNYSWPGNVRELRNAIERAIVLGEGEEVELADLALPSSDAMLGQEESTLVTLAEAERRHIHRILEECDGNKTKACKILGIGRGTLYSKLKSGS